jgi:Zn-dependent protease
VTLLAGKGVTWILKARISTVMLTEPERSQFDLQFHLFGIWVRVHPLFWLFTVFLGWPAMRVGGFTFLLAWVACVFVSILIHEMGHVFMGRLFGTDGYIVLYSFGGLAVGSRSLNNRWQRIAVSFAGPLAQLIILIPVWWGWDMQMWVAQKDLSRLANYLLGSIYIVNLYWPLMNLLPVWPLDGGQISTDLLSFVSPRSGFKAALALSATVAGVLALNSLLEVRGGPIIPYLPSGGFYTAILFAWLALGSIQLLQAQASKDRWVDQHRYDFEDGQEDWRR